MKEILILLVVIVGFPLGAVIGQKLMISVFDIRDRDKAAEKGKTWLWDVTLLTCVIVVITIGMLALIWAFS